VVSFISCAKKLLVAGGLAVSLVGFAGAAAAEPNCWGDISGGSAHQPFSIGPADDAGCGDLQDTSDTSMSDINAAGSYPGGSSEVAASPWTTVP
jgi:hypothetical protein